MVNYVEAAFRALQWASYIKTAVSECYVDKVVVVIHSTAKETVCLQASRAYIWDNMQKIVIHADNCISVFGS